mmetsp:Transcript_62272/g.150071  ORF Transcript_62272/g.150071 Transcript_62272/m.150071 type:complete len:203 (-) Transcript_62272:273-881(-)
MIICRWRRRPGGLELAAALLCIELRLRLGGKLLHLVGIDSDGRAVDVRGAKLPRPHERSVLDHHQLGHSVGDEHRLVGHRCLEEHRSRRELGRRGHGVQPLHRRDVRAAVAHLLCEDRCLEEGRHRAVDDVQRDGDGRHLGQPLEVHGRRRHERQVDRGQRCLHHHALVVGEHRAVGFGVLEGGNHRDHQSAHPSEQDHDRD